MSKQDRIVKSFFARVDFCGLSKGFTGLSALGDQLQRAHAHFFLLCF